MKGTAVIMMVLSGLCCLPCCFPRLYIYVEKPMTWADAQSYCRWKYTDLASVRNDQDWAELKELLESEADVWIGLRPDTEAWRWSLADPAFYGEGEAEFRMWTAGQATQDFLLKACVTMGTDGKWVDKWCRDSNKFVCYNGTVGTKDTSSSYIFVNESMNWEAAQTYCRKHYTDLASARNQAENDQIKEQAEIPDRGMWIGLHRNSWKWSDGSAYSFRKWASNAPTLTRTDTCTVIGVGGKWFNTNCNKKLHFACYTGEDAQHDMAHSLSPHLRMQRASEDFRVLGSLLPLSISDPTTEQPVQPVQPVQLAQLVQQERPVQPVQPVQQVRLVRLVLEKTNSSVDMEELKDNILQKFNQGLKGRGLSDDIKLRWVEQPDGKVFHKIHKKSKDEKSCPVQ